MTRRRIARSLAALAIGSALVAPGAASAQGTAPTVTLTAKSAGELIADLRYLVEAVAPPDDPRAAQALAALDGLKDPAALQGLDPSKPLGVFATLSENPAEPPSVAIFVPVLDPAKFLALFENFGATVEDDNTAPGFTKKLGLPNLPMPLYVAEGNGYLYFSLVPAGGDALKAMSPATLLPKRPGAGDLSLTVHLDRLPDQFKQQFYLGLEQSIAGQKEKKDDESDSEHQNRLAGMKIAQDGMVALVRDGKELALDLVVDPKAQFVGLELNSSAVSGSPYAEALGKLAAMKSKFRGLASGAAVGGYMAIPVSEALRDVLIRAMDEAKAKGLEQSKDNPAAQNLIAEADKAIRPTLTADTLDLGAAIRPSASSGDATYSAAVGMAVKGGKAIEAALRDALKTAPEDDKKNVTLDAAKAADGTTVHKFARLGGDGDDAKPFGEPTAYLAIRDDVAAAGIGKDGMAALNAALAAGKAAAPGVAPQMELFIATSKAAGLTDKKEQADAMKAAAQEIFTGADAKKDRISAVLTAQGAAMTFRLGADVPALKFLGRVGQNAGKVGQ